jgi:hypothetical protein
VSRSPPGAPRRTLAHTPHRRTTRHARR